MIKGIFYSLLASVLFNCIYYMSVLMNPISTQALIGYRMIFAMPFVIAAIFLLKQQRNFKFLLLKIKLKPKILLVLLATSLIVSFQMWLYLWAPSNGAALKVSIGYLIMPIVMVLFGRLFFKEHLSKTKLASIFFAAIGVFSTAVISGGISWESAVVFCLYPVYFTIRKYYNLANFSSFVIEIIFMFLFSFYFALTADMDYVMSQNPNIYYLLILLGAISGIALIAQILSSTLVPINVLGLLTYFEPIMMLFVSFAIGERLEKSSYFLMICLAISVTLLMIDSINSIKGDKNTKTK
ncbi:EamA family transporter RarD [Campylobacter concisus]|uniref:EamA family transporter RarD n=1 Tax=Campylobacter concisus TaxID=199 RepID=UPI000CD9D9B7|nr:EamA family transporter RarD [Campylobacter concisus]